MKAIRVAATAAGVSWTDWVRRVVVDVATADDRALALAAKVMSRAGGAKGRAAYLRQTTPEQRVRAARKAAKVRWDRVRAERAARRGGGARGISTG
jgi:hypothetical protein